MTLKCNRTGSSEVPGAGARPQHSAFQWCFLVFLLSLVAGSLNVASAQTEPHPNIRITIVLVPGLTAKDFTDAHAASLKKMVQTGQAGWMVCRAGKPQDPDQLRPDGREPTDSLILALGTGSRARVGPESDGIVAPTPHALHTQPFPPPGSIQALKRANIAMGYSVSVGALGDLAHAAGLKTMVLGNFDAERPDRTAYMLAMDHLGNVDDAGARLSKILADDMAPYGIKANASVMLDDFDQARNEDGLRVIAFGDLYRADRYAEVCAPQVAAQHRMIALQRLNDFLSQIVLRVEGESRENHVDSRIILLSPAPADSTKSSQDRLAPIVLWGDQLHPGAISSMSTHRASLVVNSDLLATIAYWLNQPLPAGATGRPIFAANNPSQTELLSEFVNWNQKYVNDADMQNQIGGLPTVQLLLIVVGASALMVPKFKRIASSVCIAIPAIPTAMLLLPFVVNGRIYGLVSLAICFCLLLLVGSRMGVRRLFFLQCFTLLSLTGVDLCTGCHMMQRAWMSYSATDGSRFFGIGNEYMGAVIGALVVLFPLCNTRYRKLQAGETREASPVLFSWLYLSGFALIMALMSAPHAGAKAGAIPTAGVVLIALILSLRRQMTVPEFRTIIARLAIGIFILGAVLLMDFRSGESHAVRALTGASGDAISTVLRRKLSMEAHLLLHSPWTPTMVTATLIFAYLARRISQYRQDKLTQSKGILPVSRAIFVGAVSSLICNDAGVLAASNILLMGCAWAIMEIASSVSVQESDSSVAEKWGDPFHAVVEARPV